MLSSSCQTPLKGHGNIWKPFCFVWRIHRNPSLKAFSKINRPVLLLILTLPRQFQNIEHSRSQIINEIHIYIYNIMIYSSIQYIDVYVCYAKAISPYHIMSYRRFLIIQAMSKKQKDVSV